MTVIVDAFGGDNAPAAVLQGCAGAHKELGAQILLVGAREAIMHCASEHSISLEGCKILHAPAVLKMEDDPRAAVEGTSVSVGLHALASGEGSAFVSAGSTAGLVLLANGILGCVPGAKRAAIATVIPTMRMPVVLIDSGANLNCTPQILRQFAMMGAAYARQVLGIQMPRAGLLNIGAEPNKGDALHRETYALLSANPQSTFEFIGNVEAREVPVGCCDVLVADGFSGNIFLKTYEGVAMALLESLEQSGRMNTPVTIKQTLKKLRVHMDYSQYGGAPLLGFGKVVIKAHGISNALAIRNAIRQAIACAAVDVAGSIKEAMSIL
ncbi:MAG: phosphate acyltransferase PlsX [Oscillospiraceae bacterium]|jgi:glycerol-3-phosphate acyltransferase PlsX|nr:phosphate acyltransferase PlsX [Oscillospiraceae bacterium]